MTGSRSQDVGYAVGATEPRRATCERSRSMSANLRHVGLDVHAETVAVAVAESGGEVRPLGIIPNRPEAVAKLVRKLGPRRHLRVCYEAGPCGYVLYWQLTRLGVHCDVVAPTLVPTKPGDRVKPDGRDAAKLARSYRAGDLTSVWVPDAAHEALRDLVRAREVAKHDQLRARHRLTKLLLRQGIRPPEGVKPWTQRYRRWLDAVPCDQPARQATFGDHQDRQRASAPGALGGRVGVPLPAQMHKGAAAAPTRAGGRHHRPGLESAATFVWSLSAPPRAGQTHPAGDYCRRPRALGLHLGDRRRSRAGGDRSGRGMTMRRRSRGPVKENPRTP